jgi:hypothetical protein
MFERAQRRVVFLYKSQNMSISVLQASNGCFGPSIVVRPQAVVGPAAAGWSDQFVPT